MDHEQFETIYCSETPDKKQWYFICKYCHQKHYHSANEGHRVAHCNYYKNGYIIKRGIINKFDEIEMANFLSDKLYFHLTEVEKLIECMKYSNFENRKWLYFGDVNAYQNSSDKEYAFALEGTPIRGYIIFKRIYGTIIRLDGHGKRLKAFYTYQ